MNEILNYIPTVSPSTIALLVATWVGWLVWELVGRRALFVSQARKRAARVLQGDAALEERPAPSALERDLATAGFDLGPGGKVTFILMQVGLGVSAYLLMSLFDVPPIIGLVGAGLGLWFPRSYVAGRAKGRGRRIDQEMPTALTRVAALITLQPDPVELMSQVAGTLLAADPNSLLANELRVTVAQARSVGAEQALEDLETRSPSAALSSLAFSLRTYAKAGGAYANALIESANRARAILAGRNRAQAKAAEATTAAKAIPLLLLGVGVMLFQDPIFRTFYGTAIGRVLVVTVVGVMVYGYTLIKSMVEEVG